MEEARLFCMREQRCHSAGVASDARGPRSRIRVRCYACLKMPQHHIEPYLYLAGLTHDSALIAWGAFHFTTRDVEEGWELVDDERLPSRKESIGERSEPYGKARVVVTDMAGRQVAEVSTDATNHVCIDGLSPNQRYRYAVFVDGKEWAAGERRDWCHDEQTGREVLRPSGKRYDNVFRTHPAPDEAADLNFALLGDYGVGIRGNSDSARRQREVGAALERAVEQHDLRMLLTAGDNIYLPHEGHADQGSGDEDDDWFFTYYQPYRYVINRIPVYPTVGNHDSDETEQSDDREQLEDNFFLRTRFEADQGRSSEAPGLYYRFRFGRDVEFVCIDTSHASSGTGCNHYFELAPHRAFLERVFEERASSESERGQRWLIPFAHHPPYCAGPHHGNNTAMLKTLVPLFAPAGVRVMFAGHEHNFQYSVADDIHYFVSGAGAKLRPEEPRDFEKARTRAWAAEGHFLLVQIRGKQMQVTPVARERGGELEAVALRAIGAPVGVPIQIEL